MKKTVILFGVAVSLLLVFGCGKKEAEKPKSYEMAFNADSVLLDKMGAFTVKSKVVKRTPEELKAFVGQLGAETFESYNLVGLVAALYDGEPSDLSVEVAQFDNPLDAYGYYSLTRPDGVDTLSLGLEGYISGSTFYFVQAQYAITMSVLGEPEEVSSVVLPAAITISAKIQKNPTLPGQFSLFPDSGLVVPSFKYIAENYLDIEPLSEVFTADYTLRDSPFTLFLSKDSTGEKFLAMTQRTGTNVENAPAPSGFPFDEGYAILFHDEQRGTIVSGLKGGWLLGIVGSNPELHEAYFTEWLNRWNQRVAGQS